MKSLMTYVPQQCTHDSKEYAFDEDGEDVAIEFDWFGTPEEFSWECKSEVMPSDQSGYVRLDGEIVRLTERASYVRLAGKVHKCEDIAFSNGCIVFWAEPCPEAIAFDEWQKQRPLAGVSVATGRPNSPFAEWLRKNGAEVNGTSD